MFRWMNLRGMFEEATLDFIQLQQLNFAAAFSCSHGVADLTADGLTLGFAIRHAHFQQPWAADVATPLVAGSMFRDRCVVPQVGLRKLLRQFCSPSGMTADEHTAMADAFERVQPAPADGHTALALLPMLSAFTTAGSQRRPRDADLPFLFSMGTSAPACQVLPAAVHDTAEQLAAAGGGTTAAQQLDLARTAPALYKMLKPLLGGGALPANMRSRLATLLQVRLCAWPHAVVTITLS